MKAAFFTLGCKVNQYETEILKKSFAEKGFETVSQNESADVYIINSCTVTSTGDKKTRQTLHRLRRQSPAAVIAVVGCYPQAFPDAAEKLSDADIIMGSQNRSEVVGHVLKALKSRGKIIDIPKYTKDVLFEPMSADTFSEHTRAFVKIEDGCDRYCSYCIIPKARGPVRSKPLCDLEAELKALAANGYKEIVLVGINLSSYGKDSGCRLADAVELACRIDGVERVRLGSLEPELLTDDDIDRMASSEKFCPQFHLSLQSGCDDTLKRMRRHYTSEEYAKIVEKIRIRIPNASITTDIMVGFAGETEAEFKKSLEFAEKIKFAKMHVFAYSVREGTIAAKMDGQLTKSEKERRSALMISAADKLHEEFLNAQAGKTESVLFETHENGYAFGYTKNYAPVAVRSDDESICGKIKDVIITGVCGGRCAAELL